MARIVIVDDTDPTIKYTGIWSRNSSSGLDNVGNLGPPYLNTLHGTTASGATAEFEFEGTRIFARGTVVTQSSADPIPAFGCFVDNFSISAMRWPEGFGPIGNGMRLCGETQLLDGPHTLRIEVKEIPKDQTFFLDQLLYFPSPDLPLNNKTIMFDNTDPAIRFDPEWGDWQNVANVTMSKGSTAQVNFTGSSISWVGVAQPGNSVAGTGIWKIDEGQPTQFPLPGPHESSQILYNQFYFTTPDVEVGPHTLTVTFLGDSRTTPLYLDYLLVNNGTLPPPTLTNDSPTPPSPTPHKGSPDPTPNGQGHEGSSSRRFNPAALGGALGGAAFFIITMGIILYYWRRWRIRRRKGNVNTGGPQYYPPAFSNHIRNMSDPQERPHKSPFYPTSSGVLSSIEPLIGVGPISHRAQQPSVMSKRQGTPIMTTNSHNTSSEIGRAGPSDEFPLLPEPQQDATSASQLVNQHLDSGFRLGAQPIVDVPPQYTPY